MRKMASTCLMTAVIIFLICKTTKVEGQDDYSYLIGIWEIQWEGPLSNWELIVKEIFQSENKARIIIKHPDLKLGGSIVTAQVLDINYAIFKPGDNCEITYKAPSGNEYFFKFRPDATSMSKLLRVGGGPNSIHYGEMKKKSE